MQAIVSHPTHLRHRQRLAAGCEDCRLRRDCFLANPLPEEDGDCRHVAQRRFLLSGGDRLYRLGDKCTALYQVCSGAIKTQRETADGDLLVSGFFLPGDLVGADALSDRIHPSDAIACAKTEICQLNVAELVAGCMHKPGLSQWIMSALACHVRRKDTELSWSSSQQSHQRVLRFFLELHERLAQTAPAADNLVSLPMRKQDIARYLHVTPETLSRNLAQLKREGLLQVNKNSFVLPDAPRAREASGM